MTPRVLAKGCYYLMNIESPLPASALDLFTWSRPSRSSCCAISYSMSSGNGISFCRAWKGRSLSGLFLAYRLRDMMVLRKESFERGQI